MQVRSEEQLRRELRVQICRKCPLRIGAAGRNSAQVPSRCEPTCPLFSQLGVLIRRATLLDPMLRSREQMLAHLLQERADKLRRSDLPLRQYGARAAHLIAQQFSS
jgi:hypothetical protein